MSVSGGRNLNASSTSDIPSESETRRRKAVVVGGGPVGCLAALSLAKQGWDVHLYDGRPDANSPKLKEGLRSVNLAISARGFAAVRAVDPAMADVFLQDTIPMKGRMIHSRAGVQQPQAYDILGQSINAVDRGLINKTFQAALRKSDRIQVFYEHKLTQAEFDERVLTFVDAFGKEVLVGFDFCVGADGSYSNVRRQLMRVVRMDYSQFYIPHEYMEFKIPAGLDSEGNVAFKLDPNYLHIWPRKSFMFIALANKDKSFTCSLFATGQELQELKDRPSTGLDWVKAHFPDVVPLIGESAILDSFRNNPKSPLIAIKANPYHYKDRVVILGDAAHSMVPFFGQGLNCGLEDVRVLDIILREEGVEAVRPSSSSSDSYPGDTKRNSVVVDSKLASALRRYTETRHDDLLAISDLSLANLVEMQHSVATPTYLVHRALDNVLAYLTWGWQGAPAAAIQQLSEVPFPSASPTGWLPLYTMVTFRPDISYSTLKRKAERQDRILQWGMTTAAILGLIGYAGLKWTAKR